jgi:DNA repair exonuclease SbcCD ATPase subunit
MDEILNELGEVVVKSTEIADTTPPKKPSAIDVIEEIEKQAEKIDDKTFVPPSMVNRDVQAKLLQDEDYKYSDEFLEIQTEVQSYIEDYYDIQNNIKALKEQLKDRKQEAKECGVAVTAVHKALKEIETRIKETAQEAKTVSDIRHFIESNREIFERIVSNVSQ